MDELTNNPEQILKVLAINVLHFRKQKGLTQDELAVLANFDRTYIGYIENAKVNISLIKLSDLANALNVDIRELLNDEKK